MRIGCCAPIGKYEQIAHDSYDFVEFPAWEVESLTAKQLRETVEKVRRVGVPCLRLNAYCKGSPAIVGDGFDTEKTRVYAESLMEKAAALGVERIGVGAPPARRLPEGYDPDLADRQCEEFLRITARAAAAWGIDILLEALQRGVCSYMNKTDQALAMVQKLNLENVRLVVDLYHMETQGESWDTLAAYIPWTRHVHVSTVGEGIRRGLYQLGGESDCDRAFRAIAESGYDGTVSIEPDASELTPDATKTALELMRRACRRAGLL